MTGRREDDPLSISLRLRTEAVKVRDEVSRLRSMLREALGMSRRRRKPQNAINDPLIVHRYWVTDERTGTRSLTESHMTEQQARDRYGEDAVPDPATRQERGPDAP